MAASQNGFPVISSNRTDGSLPRLRKWFIPGANRHLYLRDGSVGFLLVHLALWWHDTIHRLDSDKTWDEWGWAVRNVRGSTTTISNHASGSAEDLDATRHPRGVPILRNLKVLQVARIRLRLRLYRGAIRWGGDFRTTVDGMHFELGTNLAGAEAVALRLLETPRGLRILAVNPGAREVITSGTKAETQPRPKPTPKPKPAPKPAAKAAVLDAGTVRTPSDHLAVWAQLRAGLATFTAVTINIRATPPMRASNVRRCVDLALAVPGVSVVGFNEMGGRDLVALLEAHPTWRAVQGPKGDRRRAPIAFDTTVWELLRWENPRLSTRLTLTRLGRIAVPSGNRDATVAVLGHRETGEEVAFASAHLVAHHNVGAHFGWTGKGPKALLALRRKIANPAVAVFKQGMVALEDLVDRLRADGCYVVPMGDWNFDALADLRALAAGKAEHYGPAATMRRCGVSTVYSTKQLTRGTAGKRGIDYLGIAAPTEKRSA